MKIPPIAITPFLPAAVMLLAAGCQQSQSPPIPAVEIAAMPEESNVSEPSPADRVTRTEAEWRAMLSPEEYHVLRNKGTERPFDNEFDEHFEPGAYACAACGHVLFESDTKFNSGCGWPAFYAAKARDRVKLTPDHTHGMVRVEVTCARCDSHLGHVFDDAPDMPTGQRYCINSLSLDFIPAEE